MNISLPRTVTADEIDAFQNDGVVLMRQMFDADWISLLDKGLDDSLTDPTGRSRVWDRDEDGREVFYDSQAWQGVPEYRRFIEDSPCAAMAGQIMQSSRANFFFDAVFVRSPGVKFATPWHQDEPYWSVEGFKTCSIWMPLVPVAKESALAFVPGSHKHDKPFLQPDFGALNEDLYDDDANHVDFSGHTDLVMPDIDADPAAHGVISWDMEPGDCVVFNGRLIHGGSGNLPEDTGLRVFNTKWLGDDVRVRFRDYGMDPDHTQVMTEQGLHDGDPVTCELYPEIWTKPPVAA